MQDEIVQILANISHVITDKGLIIICGVSGLYGLYLIMKFRKPPSESYLSRTTFLYLIKLGFVGFISGFFYSLTVIDSPYGIYVFCLNTLFITIGYIFVFIINQLVGRSK